ncbi:MAG: homocysteine biosynthesis protein, partial [Actinomycetota bacterium]|nr:homocysteine biosynthesis protein [Actinomycetota bacterium]
MSKSYEEINERIKRGEAVVLTAEEMTALVREEGAKKAARKVDVVTTGTFGPMCSSGVFINLGQSDPPIRMSAVWLNDVRV